MPGTGAAVQGVFRAANERVRNVIDSVVRRGPLVVMCECSDDECLEVLELDRDAYRSVRAGGHFLVLSGHCDPELEHIVEHRDGYDIVEKANPPE